jgi:hypothetical protein
MSFAPRVAIGVSILSLVAAMVGFVAVILLNAFVLDEYDAYGDVAIPGSGSLDLPEGEVTINFQAVITGRPSGGGLPVPDLRLSIRPPEGVEDPQLTESIGSSTTVNSDAHVRVWVAQIPEPGTYEITTDGTIDGYILPRLAFGKDSSHDWLLWLFGGLFVVGLAALFASIAWSAKSGKKARPLGPQELLTFNPPTWSSTNSPSAGAGYTPTDQGVRLEQLKTLAALRDSGALTNEEFEAEKRRVLET